MGDFNIRTSGGGDPKGPRAQGGCPPFPGERREDTSLPALRVCQSCGRNGQEIGRLKAYAAGLERALALIGRPQPSNGARAARDVAPGEPWIFDHPTLAEQA